MEYNKMNNYNEKEIMIIKQCKEGPFHTLVTELSNEEFDALVDKLIKNDESYILTSLVAIYWEYNRNKIIDYFINRGNVIDLLGFLDYCNDFCTQDNVLDQKYIVDKLIEKKDKCFIKEILSNESLYFLTNKDERERLIEYMGKE